MDSPGPSGFAVGFAKDTFLKETLYFTENEHEQSTVVTVKLFIRAFLMTYLQKQCCNLCQYLKLCESCYISVEYMLKIVSNVSKVIVTDSFCFVNDLKT